MKKGMAKDRYQKPKNPIVPLRVPLEMGQRIRTLAEHNHLSDADIMRLAIDRGLRMVEEMLERKPEKTKAA
jgi:predicted DNA-binding protein